MDTDETRIKTKAKTALLDRQVRRLSSWVAFSSVLIRVSSVSIRGSCSWRLLAFFQA
jgi:hypothetical protein